MPPKITPQEQVSSFYVSKKSQYGDMLARTTNEQLSSIWCYIHETPCALCYVKLDFTIIAHNCQTKYPHDLAVPLASDPIIPIDMFNLV